MSKGSVLVACPTYAGKEYALDAWIQAFHDLKYAQKQAYMVDNTGCSQNYFKYIQSKGIDCSHIQPYQTWRETFKSCWDLILKKALAEDHYWVYSVEADNIVSATSLPTMIDLALYANIHLITHCYPLHESAAKASNVPIDSFVYNEMGCMLMSVQLLQKALAEYDLWGAIPTAIFRTAERYVGGYCQLTNKFEVKHIDGYEMEFWQFEEDVGDKSYCPTPVAPENYGSRLPDSLIGNI